LNSSWLAEVFAVLRKEAVAEMRSRTAIFTAGLFSIMTVVAMSIATYNEKLSPSGYAGVFWVALLFSALIALPRTFTIEEEQGTSDLLRLTARPHAVFWGKAIYNLIQVWLAALALSVLFCAFAHLSISIPWLFAVAMIGSGAALAGAVTLCGALVAQAANRGALAATLALPLLVPLIWLGVAALRVAIGPMGPEFMSGGIQASIGLVCYGIAALAIGPYLFAAVWKNS
jgi:heme exporter protein B